MGESRHALAELRNVSNTATRSPRRNRDKPFGSTSHDADDIENQGQQKKPQASSSSLRQETDPNSIRFLWAQVAAYNALPWACTSAASLTCPSSVSTANIAPAAAVSDFRTLLGTHCNVEIVQKPLAWTPESYFEQEKLGGDAGDSAERGTTRDEESLRRVLGTAYISPDEAKAFAAEHRTIVTVWAGDDDMVKASYLGRLLLRGHALSAVPEPPDNQWRIACLVPGDPIQQRSQLPQLSLLSNEPKPINAPAGDTTFCTFWLLTTGFDDDRRTKYATFACPSRIHAICPYLSVQYCNAGGDMNDAINDLVLTGVVGLQERMALRGKADILRSKNPVPGHSTRANKGILYFGIVISETDYQIWYIEPHAAPSALQRLQPGPVEPNRAPTCPLVPASGPSNPLRSWRSSRSEVAKPVHAAAAVPPAEKASAKMAPSESKPSELRPLEVPARRCRTLFIEPPRARRAGEDPFPGWRAARCATSRQSAARERNPWHASRMA